MTAHLTKTIENLSPVGLDTLNALAHLQTRKDRKYILTAEQLSLILDRLPSETRSLEIDERRCFTYESIYFDTPHLDAYRMAATKRPHRFKVRTRHYLDAGRCVLEVKTKNRRGQTVKHAQEHDTPGHLDAESLRFLEQFKQVEPYLDDLRPVLTSRYLRSTLVFQDTRSRATIDASFSVTSSNGATKALSDKFIVETKSSGSPTPLDRLLWTHGVRPLKISKFATGLAAIQPSLPANRWHRVLQRHFGRDADLLLSGESRLAHSKLTASTVKI